MKGTPGTRRWEIVLMLFAGIPDTLDILEITPGRDLCSDQAPIRVHVQKAMAAIISEQLPPVLWPELSDASNWQACKAFETSAQSLLGI